MKTTRRHFLSATATLAASATLPRSIFAQPGKLASDPNRPQFHLLPARNWMNDPNGPIYVNGQYHMFFQYNPHAATWGDMNWYHSISPDMLHWQHLPVALTPTPNSPDAFGCFSGSALQVGSRVYQVYTGTRLGPREDATIMGDANPIQESQCLAYSDDPRLIRWTKLPQPIIPLPPPGLKITGFRDPSIWKQGDGYYMTVGAGEANVGGCVLLYHSRFIDRGWQYLHKLTAGEWSEHKTQNPCDDGEMWECPDFFPLGDPADGRHVLIYSTLGKVFWQSGKLDTVSMTFVAGKTGELDLGAFYAPKTQLDAHGRRILWGWVREKRSPDDKQNEAAMTQAGWSGMMSLPRVLSLDPDGTLRITALPESTRLRARKLPQLESFSGIRRTIPHATGEVFCTANPGSPMQLTLSGTASLLDIRYNPQTHTFHLDGKVATLAPTDIPTIHAFIDGSVIEVILADRIGYTKRFYADAPNINVLALGATMDAWTLRPISPNRLTT